VSDDGPTGADRPEATDQAHRLLARARRSAPQRRRRPRRTPPEEQAWSGPGADPRDPTPVGAAVGDLVRQNNWDTTLRAAGIEARWAQIVGADVAATSNWAPRCATRRATTAAR
jgi:predicted nucleic acid-binding Zn ribbon protein